MRRFVLFAAVLAGAGAVAVETFFRVEYGLATPPLYAAHPTIEYIAKPDQDVRIFGNHQVYNSLSMRSPPLSSVQEDRTVLVFGDSVLNGGTALDQADLATSLATARSRSDGRPTFFGNVSAKSWGPANIIGWIEEHGFLDADTAIFVLSSHDYYDLPTFEPLDPTVHPTERPLLALNYVLSRVMSRVLPSGAAQASPPPTEEDVRRGEREVAGLIDRAAEAGLKVCLIQHMTKSELSAAPDLGHAEIKRVFASRGVPIQNLGTALSAKIDQASDPFIDDIHI
ncbi:MAG: hypothetical protein AAGF58_14630, partial [Pseudomonadota bacterium]